jgi:hypothetical protein
MPTTIMAALHAVMQDKKYVGFKIPGEAAGLIDV